MQAPPPLAPHEPRIKVDLRDMPGRLAKLRSHSQRDHVGGGFTHRVRARTPRTAPPRRARMAPTLALLLAASLSTSVADDPWAPVRTILDNFQNLTDCAGCNCKGCHGFTFTAGDASGRKFTYEKGHTTLHKPLLMASASKFPAAIAIAGAVAEGHLSFDTRASEVFPWWSSDAADKRSGVTLRHLLSFTSGFYWVDASSGDASCMSGLAGMLLYTPEACAKQIYEKAPFNFAPGSTCARRARLDRTSPSYSSRDPRATDVSLRIPASPRSFAYNSFHLQARASTPPRGLPTGLPPKASPSHSLTLTPQYWVAPLAPPVAVPASRPLPLSVPCLSQYPASLSTLPWTFLPTFCGPRVTLRLEIQSPIGAAPCMID